MLVNNLNACLQKKENNKADRKSGGQALVTQN